MLVNISEDLIIETDNVLYIKKNGKDIFLKFNNGIEMVFSSLQKEGKALLKYFRSIAQES